MARYYNYLLFLLISSYCEGQGQKSHFTSTNEYLDFVVADQQIWAVTKTGNLRIFDIFTGEPIGDIPQIDSPIIAIAKDRNSNIALGFGGKISVYNRNLKTWSILGPYENKILGIVFGASDA